MASWNDFGKFIASLNKGRDQLPENIKVKVDELTRGVSDPLEKVIRLYGFMQQNTRYISIQLGIGGWQPFSAEFVGQKGYDDCKALTNYMQSLIKHAGIKSYYALIKSGDGRYHLNTDFPANQFNHAILAVPLENDTMWLECTSQTIPAGFLGSQTDNRPALLILEDGAKFAQTKSYGKEENTHMRIVSGEIDQSGMLKLKANNYYTGLEQELQHDVINILTKDRIKEFLNRVFDLTTYDVNHFRYNEIKTAIPKIEEDLELTVYKYATITGKRMMITPNVLTRGGYNLTADPERKTDILIKYAYKNTDSVSLRIPDGYEVEYQPTDVNLETAFGKYTTSVKIEGNSINYFRHIEINGGRYPGSRYQLFSDFMDKIYKTDRERIVLVKKDQ